MINKAKINAKKKQKFNCECGGRYTHINKLRHMKSKNHNIYNIATMHNVNL